MSIYVASSWRCAAQPTIVAALRDAGHEVYDFRKPPGGTGFHWSAVGVNSSGEAAAVYLAALGHPIARAGLASDREALDACDTCVLVLPCGRSAHLELGYAIGQGKRTAILLDADPVTPELMYALADLVTADIGVLLDWLAAVRTEP